MLFLLKYRRLTLSIKILVSYRSKNFLLFLPLQLYRYQLFLHHQLHYILRLEKLSAGQFLLWFLHFDSLLKECHPHQTLHY